MDNEQLEIGDIVYHVSDAISNSTPLYMTVHSFVSPSEPNSLFGTSPTNWISCQWYDYRVSGYQLRTFHIKEVRKYKFLNG